MPDDPFVWARHASLIDALAEATGTTLEPSTAMALGRYVELVAMWNRKLDLTGARDAEAQVEVLLADSLVLADPRWVAADSQLVDVGSGAGAPVLPLLLQRPDLRATLIEPLHKRVAFLRVSAARLDLLSRAAIVEGRVDLDAPERLGVSAGLAMSRATFAPERWLAVALALAPSALVMLADVPSPAPPKGAELVAEDGYRLPMCGAPRRLALYRRV